LEYQLGRCEAPCQSLQTGLEYAKIVLITKKIFSLQYKELKNYISSQMKKFADELNFEKAHDYLCRLKNVDLLEEKLEPIRVRIYNKKAMEIKKALGLKNLPLIIEAFDNSHNQGDSNVAASVRYLNDKPQKSEYRKYIIREEDNRGDDCRSFQEVIYRRFKRVLEEKGQLPHLVIIDGGKGQLNSAKGILESMNLLDKVDIISISKDDNHRSQTIHLTDSRRVPMIWPTLGVIQEEIHRFAIKFHRERSTKKLLKSIGIVK
jgi:excinuclease ABC subunit C